MFDEAFKGYGMENAFTWKSFHLRSPIVPRLNFSLSNLPENLDYCALESNMNPVFPMMDQ